MAFLNKLLWCGGGDGDSDEIENEAPSGCRRMWTKVKSWFSSKNGGQETTNVPNPGSDAATLRPPSISPASTRASSREGSIILPQRPSSMIGVTIDDFIAYQNWVERGY
ncbi:hypothetical protein CISG_04642 [Coccidioides immitis RMSCC 3703]|uniref:Uncharacterized protein n=2 Tax=Coccidioides immitis TaxID=5501 RepID=A0A0J8QSR5_COCIT|nr:hypothetical protein CIRG_01264 [Coccidioides immitis RMSCC 2394]KMU74293.1 hypothetical protein CISG_04642 [Coccidioides immitis RMSCC 3703]